MTAPIEAALKAAGIIKMCRRCVGTGFVARHMGRLVYCKCPRCAGKGGKRARILSALTLGEQP